MSQDLVFQDVAAERKAQDEQWGGLEHDRQHTHDDWIQQIIKHTCKANSNETFRVQMVKVAALAVAAIEAFDGAIGASPDSNDIDGIKIFAMNDCDWVAARTKEEAIDSYEFLNGADDHEEVRELSAAELDSTTPWMEDDKRIQTTFRDQLRKMIAAGVSFPAFFASTEY